MNLVSNGDANTPLAGEDRFAVNLTIKGRATPEVCSCEVIGAHHKARFSFPADATIDDVFVPEISRGLAQCLVGLTHTTEVMPLPRMAIEIPGLSLAQAHVLSTRNENDSLAIIVRFRTILGGINRAFRQDLGIEDSVPEHCSHMSAAVLADIVLPLLDLCAAAEGGALETSKGLDDFIETLIERSQDVRFQAELVKRFVATATAFEKPRKPQKAARPKIELITHR